MPLSRRRFLFTGSLTAAGAALVPVLAATKDKPKAAAADLSDWSTVRREFDLDPAYIHLSLFYMTAHPRAVREAIAAHRRKLDANPLETVEHNMFGPPEHNMPLRTCSAIADYIGGSADDIALTQNTTMGLALVYHGLPLKSGDEILTTTHDHFVHHEAIRLAAERNGASWRKIALFDSYDAITAGGIVDRIRAGIRPNTRVVGVTWVHSSSGLRLPIRRIADAVAEVNRNRDANSRVLLVVDGVHGVGVEDPKIATLGADVFAAGLHKWIFGPRGTGFVWAKPEVWATMRPLVPSFTSFELFSAWSDEKPPAGPARANWFTPGGFQAFDHWWAVPAAIDFHRKIGPARVTQRIHALNQQLGDELRKLPNVTKVYTPKDPSLNAGMVCFDIAGLSAAQVVEKLHAKKVLASTTPYKISFARLACGITNTAEEVEKTVRAVRSLS